MHYSFTKTNVITKQLNVYQFTLQQRQQVHLPGNRLVIARTGDRRGGADGTPVGNPSLRGDGNGRGPRRPGFADLPRLSHCSRGGRRPAQTEAQ